MPFKMPNSSWIRLAANPWRRARMMGMPPHTEASKAISTPRGRGQGQQVVTVVGQEGLVGGDHVFFPGDGAEPHSPGPQWCHR